MSTNKHLHATGARTVFRQPLIRSAEGRVEPYVYIYIYIYRERERYR